MKRLASIGICLLLAGPALADSVTEKTGVNSLAGAAPSTQDFVQDAAMSDLFEIQSGKLAEHQATAKATKSFAERMVADHLKTAAALKSMIRQGNVHADLPKSLDSAHRDLLDKLKGESGDDFDRTYKEQQIDAHNTAVSLFERYAADGDNGTLKRWAGQTVPVLHKHQKDARALRSEVSS